jgi:hypothetical protein
MGAKHFLVALLLFQTCKGDVAADSPSDLEARFLLKKQALESKMAAAKVKEEARLRAHHFSTVIQDENGTNYGELIYPGVDGEGQHPADFVFNKCVERNVPSNIRHKLSDEICKQLFEKCEGRTRGLVKKTPITAGPDDIIGTIELYDGEEAIDVAYDFVQRHKQRIPLDSVSQIFQALCEWPSSMEQTIINPVTCTRKKPLIYHRPKGWASLPEDLFVYEGEEAVDVIHHMIVEKFKFEKDAYRNLADRVCLPFHKYKIKSYFKKADEEYNEVIKKKFRYFKCRRHRIIEQTLPIGGGPQSQAWGHVEIVEGEEPIDAIFSFVNKYKLEPSARGQIFNVICSNRESLGLKPCSRNNARLFHENMIEFVSLYALEKQLNRYHKVAERRPLDDYLHYHNNNANNANKNIDSNSNDNTSAAMKIIVDRFHASYDEFEKLYGNITWLTIWEGEEPADVVHKWCEQNGLDESIRTEIINKMCSGYFR